MNKIEDGKAFRIAIRVALWDRFCDKGLPKVSTYSTLGEAMAFVHGIEDGLIANLGQHELYFTKGGKCREWLASIRATIEDRSPTPNPQDS